jgi:hypothetical protein
MPAQRPSNPTKRQRVPLDKHRPRASLHHLAPAMKGKSSCWQLKRGNCAAWELGDEKSFIPKLVLLVTWEPSSASPIKLIPSHPIYQTSIYFVGSQAASSHAFRSNVSNLLVYNLLVHAICSVRTILPECIKVTVPVATRAKHAHRFRVRCQMKKDILTPGWVLGVRLTSVPRKTQLSKNSGNGETMARKWAETTQNLTIK